MLTLPLLKFSTLEKMKKLLLKILSRPEFEPGSSYILFGRPNQFDHQGTYKILISHIIPRLIKVNRIFNIYKLKENICN